MAVAVDYQARVRAETNRYVGVALVGVHSVVIGWDVKRAPLPSDHLGFAIRRTDFDVASGEVLRRDFLRGFKSFFGPGVEGQELRSDGAPFQRFRWNDYTLKPELSYCFEVFPVRGTPRNTRLEDPLVFNLRPSAPAIEGVGVYVNRGVTAARAYYNKFGDSRPEDVPDGAASDWLERGLLRSLLDFIDGAKRGDELHVCIYEFYLSDVIEALRAAKQRGVAVKIVYHAKGDDHASHENEENVRDAGLVRVSTPRTKVGRLSHNKFIIHLVRGQPKRVWMGSANFTKNAFYFQTNVALVFENEALAVAYEDYFQLLDQDMVRMRPKAGRMDVRDNVQALNNSLNPGPAPASQVMFSAERGEHIVDKAIELIQGAKSAVFVSAPFGVDQRILDAIDQSDRNVVKYGLANATAQSRVKDLNGWYTRFFWPSKMETFNGERWDAKAFGAHKIHTKSIIVDPWSNDSTVMVGSANFSEASSKHNDENTLVIKGDHRITAILATEFMRMYDHYKSRFYAKDFAERGVEPGFAPLKADSSWADTYFKRHHMSHKFRDRQVFSGRE